MTPQSLNFSPEFSNYIPEDRDQRIVKTPYGTGIIIRTRKDNDVERKSISRYETELLDCTTSKLDNHGAVSSFNKSNPKMLYTPIKFPSVSPVVGSDVLTQWGRGKVSEIRDDHRRTHVVKLSSWRLAGRSFVYCYVSVKECEVVKPHKIYDMDVFEKVEHAKDLKQQATVKFKEKDYDGALELFARAVDTVRYVQHGVDSTNELRADLIFVIITCANNAALCSSKKDDWERAEKFGESALVLIEALEEKWNESKIKTILNSDGIGDSQLFGTWKVKSLLLIAKSQMERHDAAKMKNALKKALKAISFYRNENDSMYKQLSIQENDIRRLRLQFSKNEKLVRNKEKKRARAMFGRTNQESRDSKNHIPESSSISSSCSTFQYLPHLSLKNLPALEKKSYNSSMRISDKDMSGVTKSKSGESSNKKVVTASEIEDDPARVDANEEDEDDDYTEPTFFEEHSEALLILSGFILTCFVVQIVTKKR